MAQTTPSSSTQPTRRWGTSGSLGSTAHGSARTIRGARFHTYAVSIHLPYNDLAKDITYVLCYIRVGMMRVVSVCYTLELVLSWGARWTICFEVAHECSVFVSNLAYTITFHLSCARYPPALLHYTIIGLCSGGLRYGCSVLVTCTLSVGSQKLYGQAVLPNYVHCRDRRTIYASNDFLCQISTHPILLHYRRVVFWCTRWWAFSWTPIVHQNTVQR